MTPSPMSPSNASKNHAICFRPANNSDEAYVNDLTRRTMIDYVSQTWSEPDDIETYFRKNAFVASVPTWLIMLNDRPIGRLSHNEATTDTGRRFLLLDNLHLEFQGKGIGSFAIKELSFKAATAVGLPVCLLVLRVNPARTAYERLGFRIVGQSNTRYYMGWNVPTGFLWNGGLVTVPPENSEHI